MRSILALAAACALAVPAFAAKAETWKNVTLVDGMCAAKVKAAPDEHTAACLKSCAGSGVGILTSDGTFLKFDKKSEQTALKQLDRSGKTDHLRVNVTGVREGDTIKVQNVSFE